MILCKRRTRAGATYRIFDKSGRSETIPRPSSQSLFTRLTTPRSEATKIFIILQLTGPAHAIVCVEAVLYIRLVASFCSKFLQMIGKQWWIRYASTDLRGSAIERLLNWQRKHDAINSWHFDYFMVPTAIVVDAVAAGLSLFPLSLLLGWSLWVLRIKRPDHALFVMYPKTPHQASSRGQSLSFRDPRNPQDPENAVRALETLATRASVNVKIILDIEWSNVR
ncbi:hypothetical protein BJ322DRAFT_293065 [Thelephora terrestris]|uniref:DUF6535 domain-containing protein n=1 Tax=Thelephora terrestris TaxID=56493 RepID=A0A9P6L3D0_9AGAM|nr:hypothetical protein BJ322DRAFT_293065 [Thelephora terrestris]